MRYVEVFRHSKTGESKGLSEEGRKLAQEARRLLAPRYELYISSPKERAIRTIQELGFERFEVEESFKAINPWEPFDTEVTKRAKERGIIPLAACFEIPPAVSFLKLQGETLIGAIKRIARRLPEEGRALVVSHGGMLEAAALLGFPRYHLEEIGGEIRFCEAAVFELEGEQLVRVEIKRLSQPSAGA